MIFFSGVCRGGPLDGQDLEHNGPRYRLIVPLAAKRMQYHSVECEYIYILGQWIYHGPHLPGMKKEKQT
jgi:hypothetical protein